MRALALLAVALLTTPLVGSIAPSSSRGLAATPGRALAADLPDGELVRLLALHEGIPAGHPAPLALPADATVPSLVLALAARARIPMDASQAARFSTLDPRVAGPLVTLLAAVDQSWGLTEKAFARLSPDQRAQMKRLAEAGRYQDPEFQRLYAQVDKAALVDAAIVLLDAVEGVAIPALQEAAAAGAWPPAGVWDPGVDGVGVLRLGSTGPDVETVDRIVQIDPSGDDTYLNNAGGANLVESLSPPKPGYDVALSLDLGGNDVYANERYSAQGGGFGVGVLEDLAGDDRYTCDQFCEGASSTGVGVLRDYAGDDSYDAGDWALGYGAPLGVLRDDGGNDAYVLSGAGGGFAFGDGTAGLLWDLAGTDEYHSRSTDQGEYGFAIGGGDGWFVHEGVGLDSYTDENGPIAHACNDCSWSAGLPPSSGDGKIHGAGLDNRGSIGELLNSQYGTNAEDLGPSPLFEKV